MAPVRTGLVSAVQQTNTHTAFVYGCVGSVHDRIIRTASMPSSSTQAVCAFPSYTLTHIIDECAQCSCLSSRADGLSFYRAAFVVCVCRVVEFVGSTGLRTTCLKPKGSPTATQTSRIFDSMPMMARLWHIAHATITHSASQRAVIAARCVAVSHELFCVALRQVNYDQCRRAIVNQYS